MPNTDKEVFEYFRNSSESPEVAGLAYASYAFEKYEWYARHEERHGAPPTSEEVDEWIASQPETRLDGIVTQATDLFDGAARVYMEDEIEHQKQRAAKRAVSRVIRKSNRNVLKQVRRATSYWRNFLGNIFIGFVSSIIFVLVVAGGAWVFNSDPSAFALIKGLLNGHAADMSSPKP